MALTTRATAARAAALSRPRTVAVSAAAWQKATTKTELNTAGGRQVVELGGQKVLIVETEGQVYAVSNKCSHLGLPLVGKTAFFQGQVKDKCIVCPAHDTAFDLATGEVKGEWCPKFPTLPLVGKMTDKKPLPTFESRVDDAGNIEVLPTTGCQPRAHRRPAVQRARRRWRQQQRASAAAGGGAGMAGGGAKKRADDNARTVRLVGSYALACTLVHVLVRLWLRGGSADWVAWAAAAGSAAAQGVFFVSIAAVARPVWQNGVLVDGGGDLGKGMISYYFDLLYVTGFAQVLAAFTRWGWYVLAVVPATAAYLLATKVILPMRARRNQPGVELDEATLKKLERAERRSERRRVKRF
ncbi:hypothetical protein HT031_000284 [Scenedesmus sp. PABB004]|nr:hypothetical protein HT031_000284 [Scenedesmus sp. PABB004]